MFSSLIYLLPLENGKSTADVYLKINRTRKKRKNSPINTDNISLVAEASRFDHGIFRLTVRRAYHLITKPSRTAGINAIERMVGSDASNTQYFIDINMSGKKPKVVARIRQ